MRQNKQASSQAAWALLMEGVSHARVDAHRLKHLINRAIRLVEASDEKEHLYQVAGDIIVGIPKRLEHLETDLDRTGLALSKMGAEFLSARLSLSDKAMVDEAVEAAFGRGTPKDSDVERLARRFMLSAVKFPNTPDVIQEIIDGLEKASGVRSKKIADFHQWEFSGDYSYITYHPKRPRYLNVSGKKGSKAFTWFAHRPEFRQFSMEVMNGGADGPTEWHFKLKTT